MPGAKIGSEIADGQAAVQRNEPLYGLLLRANDCNPCSRLFSFAHSERHIPEAEPILGVAFHGKPVIPHGST